MAVEVVFDINVDDRKVKKTVVTTVSGHEFRQVWTMDFGDCTDRDMLDMASRCFVIDQQAKMRGKHMSEADRIDMGEKVLNVKAMMGKGAVKKDATAKIVDVAGSKMTAEERAELIRRLQELQPD